ncbi:MAG: hypothetical protein JO275_00220, partial [Verrucomicrobia bacterium]|nr:hypothetical protein [Verrucomicrobiota bacterium]
MNAEFAVNSILQYFNTPRAQGFEDESDDEYENEGHPLSPITSHFSLFTPHLPSHMNLKIYIDGTFYEQSEAKISV